jgi:hypothetical protein
MVGSASTGSPRMLVLFLAGAMAVVTASCGAAPRGATDLARAKAGVTTDLARAKADCAAVGRWLGAPPGGQRRWIREIMSAPRSGISAVDAPMHDLATALRGDSTARTSRAVSDMVRACARRGLWQTYH